MSDNINRRNNFCVKLYYEFGGSIEWLKDEIIKKRYDSFRYLLPITNKDKGNIILELCSIENSDEKFLTVISFLKFAGVMTFPRIICKNHKITSRECCTIYCYLKETYFENNRG